MSCKHGGPRLTALADNELGLLEAWRLRRHLRHCADCAALYTDICRVHQLTQKYRAETTVSPPLSIAGWEPLAASQEAATAASRKERKMLFSLSTPLTRRSLLVAAAGIGVAVSLGTLPRLGVAKPAFAEVRAAVQQLRYVHLLFYVNAPDAQSDENQDTSEPVVAQTEAAMRGETPLMNVWLDLPRARYNMEFIAGVRVVGSPQGQFLYPADSAPLRLSEKGVTSESLQREMLSPERLRNAGKKPTDTPEAQWSVGESETINGQSLVRFTADDPDGTHRVLWANPETHLPVRFELETPAKPGFPASAMKTWGVYQYNETPPAGIFDAPTKR